MATASQAKAPEKVSDKSYLRIMGDRALFRAPPIIHLPTHFPSHSSTLLFLHLSFLLFIHSASQPATFPSIHSDSHLSFHPPTFPFFHPCVHSLIFSPTHPFISPSISSPLHLPPSVHPSICRSVHPSIHHPGMDPSFLPYTYICISSCVHQSLFLSIIHHPTICQFTIHKFLLPTSLSPFIH